MYKIGDFSKMVGIPVRTLRFYDECGVLKPSKVDPFTSYRYYQEEDIEDIQKIQQLKELGFTLEEIIEYKDKLTSEILEQKRQELEQNIYFLKVKIYHLEQLKIQLQEQEGRRKVYEKRNVRENKK